MPPAEQPSPFAAAKPKSFCTNCGKPTPSNELVSISGRLVCAGCKPAFLQQIREGGQPLGQHNFAGFWIRFAAVLIDGVLIGTVNAVISMVLIAPFQMRGGADALASGVAVGAILLTYLLIFALTIGYEVFFIGSSGATLGKRVLGLKAVRADGGKISYGLAAGRYFAKIVSGLPCYIGFLMAAWDEERRALHDRICNTRVIKTR